MVQEKEVEINGKKFLLKKVKWVQFIKASTNDSVPKEERPFIIVKMCAGITDEELNDLDIDTGNSLMDAVNELHGVGKEKNFPPTKS